MAEQVTDSNAATLNPDVVTQPTAAAPSTSSSTSNQTSETTTGKRSFQSSKFRTKTLK